MAGTPFSRDRIPKGQNHQKWSAPGKSPAVCTWPKAKLGVWISSRQIYICLRNSQGTREMMAQGIASAPGPYNRKVSGADLGAG